MAKKAKKKNGKYVCPSCGTTRTVQSHHRDRQERIRSWVFIRPFRCQECNARFFRFRITNYKRK